MNPLQHALPYSASGFARHFFVDAKTGRDSRRDGRTPASALKTMEECFGRLRSGDVIWARGKIREQLETPAGVFDVTIIGAGAPRHADDHTESGGKRGSSAACWLAPASPTASTPLLKVRQQGWTIANMLFGAAPAATPSVMLFRDGGAGDAERDASHFRMVDCRIDGSPIGIQDSGGCAFVRIERTLFRGMTTAAINNITGAGIGTLLAWRIMDNWLHDNAIGIDLASTQASILRNVIGKHTTYGIDLNGGANNGVHGNWLHGNYTTDNGQYRAGTNDEWSGNFSMDEDEGTVTSGVTHAVPTTD
jgi:hypothetical protein